MKDIISDNKYLIEHIVEHQIKPLFKSCKVHVSNMDNTINISVGLISNVIHTMGHSAIPDPLKLSLTITILPNEYGTNTYRLDVDKYIIHLKNNKVFVGLCCCLGEGSYFGMLMLIINWITGVYLSVYDNKNELHIRDDIKHLYI